MYALCVNIQLTNFSSFKVFAVKLSQTVKGVINHISGRTQYTSFCLFSTVTFNQGIAKMFHLPLHLKVFHFHYTKYTCTTHSLVKNSNSTYRRYSGCTDISCLFKDIYIYFFLIHFLFIKSMNVTVIKSTSLEREFIC